MTGILSLAAAYALATPELLLLAVLATLLPTIAALLVRFRRIELAVTRSFDPAVVAAGQQTVVDLVVQNASPTSSPALAWRDPVSWQTGGIDPSGVVRALAARRGRLHDDESIGRARYGVVPPSRGIHRVGPLSVMLEDPFGLARGEVPAGGEDRLVVTPPLPVLPETGLAILHSDGTSMLVSKAVGGEDDLSTREYRRGDPIRRVHWRATARHGELMVRQEEPRSRATARVVLETRRAGYPDADQLPGSRADDEEESASFELALSLAGSIATHLSRQGFEVEVVETGHPQFGEVSDPGPFAESLATARLSDDRGGYDVDASSANGRVDGSRGSVFAVVAEPEGLTLDRLESERSSFTLAVAFVISARPSDAVERLRRAGWSCVSMRPDDTVEAAWHAVPEALGAHHAR